MRTLVITKQAHRQFQARLIVDGNEAFAFSGKASVSNALSVGKFIMAGMSDNPLIGDYTKGISKGASYFEGLERRFKREKVDTKVLAEDLASPFSRVMQRQNPLSESYGKRGFERRKNDPELLKKEAVAHVNSGSQKSRRHVKTWSKGLDFQAFCDHFDT